MNWYKKTGYLLAVFGGLFWSISGVCGQYLFTYKGWSANGLVPFRMLFAGIILTVFCIIRYKKGMLSVFGNKRDIGSLIVFAVCGLALCQFTYFKAISLSNAAVVTAIQYTSPALIVLYMLLFKKKLPTFCEVIAVILAIGGTLILSTHLDFSAFSIGFRAFIYAFVSTVAVAVYAIQPVNLLKKYGTIQITALGMLLGGILLCLIMNPVRHIGKIDLYALLAFFTIVIFGSVLSFTFFLEGVKRIGSVQGNILSATEPVGSAVLCVIFMGTPFTAYDYIGIVMIISTVFVLALGENKKH